MNVKCEFMKKGTVPTFHKYQCYDQMNYTNELKSEHGSSQYVIICYNEIQTFGPYEESQV